MKKYQLPLVSVIAASIILGFILSALIIKPPLKNVRVLHVTPIPSTFPDIKNDSNYKNFLNTDAIDPTQAVRVGGSQNSSPFNGTQ